MITINPMNMFVKLRDNFTNVSLSCEAVGASAYSWQRQHGAIPFNSVGVNTSMLTLINLRLKDAGNYKCVVTNNSGSAESDYATLHFRGTV